MLLQLKIVPFNVFFRCFFFIHFAIHTSSSGSRRFFPLPHMNVFLIDHCPFSYTKTYYMLAACLLCCFSSFFFLSLTLSLCLMYEARVTNTLKEEKNNSSNTVWKCLFLSHTRLNLLASSSTSSSSFFKRISSCSTFGQSLPFKREKWVYSEYALYTKEWRKCIPFFECLSFAREMRGKKIKMNRTFAWMKRVFYYAATLEKRRDETAFALVVVNNWKITLFTYNRVSEWAKEKWVNARFFWIKVITRASRW